MLFSQSKGLHSVRGVDPSQALVEGLISDWLSLKWDGLLGGE